MPGTAKLSIVPAGGGPSRELRSDFAAAGYPIWTPDGHILFLGNEDPKAISNESAVDWWVTGIGDRPTVATGASKLFRDPGFATVSQAAEAWTSDGPSVLFSAMAADTRNLWRVPISLATWKVSGAPRRLTFATNMDIEPSLSGRHLAFAS